MEASQALSSGILWGTLWMLERNLWSKRRLCEAVGSWAGWTAWQVEDWENYVEYQNLQDYVKMKNVGYTNNAGKFEMFMMIVP